MKMLWVFAFVVAATAVEEESSVVALLPAGMNISQSHSNWTV